MAYNIHNNNGTANTRGRHSKFEGECNMPSTVVDEIITEVETTTVAEHVEITPASHTKWEPVKESAAKTEPIKQSVMFKEQRQGKPEKQQPDEITNFIQHFHAVANSKPGATFVPFRKFHQAAPGGCAAAPNTSPSSGNRPVGGTTNTTYDDRAGGTAYDDRSNGWSKASGTNYDNRSIGWSKPGGVAAYGDLPDGWTKPNSGTTPYADRSDGWAKPNMATTYGSHPGGWATYEDRSSGWSKPNSGTNYDDRFSGWARPTSGITYDNSFGGWGKSTSGTTYGDRPSGWTRPTSETTYNDYSSGWTRPNSGTTYIDRSRGWTKPTVGEDRSGGWTRPNDDYSGKWTKPTGGTYDDRSGGWTRPSSVATYNDGSNGWGKPRDISTNGWSRTSSGADNGLRQPSYENSPRRVEPAIEGLRISSPRASDGRNWPRWSWPTPPSSESSITKPANNFDAIGNQVKEPPRPAAAAEAPRPAGRFAPLSSSALAKETSPVETIDSREAARRYQGLEVEGPPEKTAAPTIDSQEAAKKYHGTITNYTIVK